MTDRMRFAAVCKQLIRVMLWRGLKELYRVKLLFTAVIGAPEVQIQPVLVCGRSRAAGFSSPAGILPFGFRGQPVTAPCGDFFIQGRKFLAEAFRGVPVDCFHRVVRVAKATRVGPHDSLELLLRNFVDSDMEGLVNTERLSVVCVGVCNVPLWVSGGPFTGADAAHGDPDGVDQIVSGSRCLRPGGLRFGGAGTTGLGF